MGFVIGRGKANFPRIKIFPRTSILRGISSRDERRDYPSSDFSNALYETI